MQRVDLRGRSVRVIVAVFAALALLTAGFGIGGSSQNASAAVRHLCPPMC
jgi:hypothetical protein